MNSYREITQAAAWDIMQHEKGFVILDVRRPEEYAGGHIKGAVNVPLETIDAGKFLSCRTRTRRFWSTAAAA